MILEYEGYTVEYSTSAIQGLKVIEENQIACLLLDIQMPEMSGFEVLKKVKESMPSLSVIIISAHGSVENAIKAEVIVLIPTDANVAGPAPAQSARTLPAAARPC